MRHCVRRILVCAIGISVATQAMDATAKELPGTIASSRCRTAPTIDGKISPGEWADAKVIDFDLTLLKVKSVSTSTRTCQFRVMNSANALYVSLRVPDKAVNNSFTPLDFDFASLAFCRGDDVTSGDDRKVAAVGVYIDKHVTQPGKDADDKQQDGRAFMLHDAESGTYTIEWALPLNSKDPEDLQAKPGDAVRFNLAYVDSFQQELRDTEIGSAFPGGLDKAKDWGTLKLASDVVDDGGAAFRGPEWVQSLFKEFTASSSPANRLRLVESTTVPSPSGQVHKALVEFDYRDPEGKAAKGLAKLYLPAAVEKRQRQFPLIHSAGYELDDAGAVGLVGQGFVVLTARGLESNPLVRTVNPDVALLHIARSLPIIDDAKVVVTGGSAGGYITLMVASETFPLAGAAPGVPPVNWGYNAAYFLQRDPGGTRQDPKGPATPVFDVIVPIVQQALKVYGDDPSDVVYFRNSPLAHLPTVTCPVLVHWTTADMLVPIDQVGKTWVRPIDATKFPAGFTFDPDKLTTSPEGRRRLTDVLNPNDYEVFLVSEQEIKKYLVAGKGVELAISETRRWSITILDEGAPEPQVGHNKYPVSWSQRKFLAQSIDRKIAADQLTALKLERLMDRYAGREWLPATLVHLDEPGSEQADVIRGLKTYVKAGTEHAKTFASLYGKLSMERQVLPVNLVKELTTGSARE